MVSREQQVHKAVTRQQLQHQLILHHPSHQIKLLVEVTIIPHKQKTISQPVHLEQLDIRRNALLLAVLDFLQHKVQLVLDSLIPEPNLRPVDLHIPEPKVPLPVHLIQLPVNPKYNDQQALALNDLPQSEPNQGFLHLNKDQLEDLEQELKVVETAAAVDRHHPANKMKARKETIQPFPGNQTLITQFCLKFHQRPSIVTNRNSQDTTLMSRPVVKFSIFVL